MAKRGRPKLNLAKREVLQVRVLPEVKREFIQASHLAGQSLSKWATQRLSEAAQKELEKNHAEADNTS
jgi:predicted HicB family RNase H-like nuclease